jgi:hypothetical protein
MVCLSFSAKPIVRKSVLMAQLPGDTWNVVCGEKATNVLVAVLGCRSMSRIHNSCGGAVVVSED